MCVLQGADQKLLCDLTEHPSPWQVWFQNCRARHKKHVSPNHSSSAPVTAVPSSRLSPPMLEEMAYSAYVPQDGTMLTALHSYMDGKSYSW